MGSNTVNNDSSNYGDVEVHSSENNIAAGAVQCPIQDPYSKFAAGKTIIDSCCKCKNLTQCTSITDIDNGAGINHNNVAGVNAMRAENDTIDKSKI